MRLLNSYYKNVTFEINFFRCGIIVQYIYIQSILLKEYYKISLYYIGELFENQSKFKESIFCK